MPVEVLVANYEWDKPRIAGIVYESTVELLKQEGGISPNDKYLIARSLFADNTPLVDVTTFNPQGIPIVRFTAPSEIEILPDGELVTHNQSPEARISVRPSYGFRHDTIEAKNKWEATRRTLEELATSYNLRCEPYNLEIIFPTKSFAKKIEFNKAVILDP